MTGEAEERKSFHDVPTRKKGAPAKKVARSAEISVFALPEAGLEPARGNAPWDFKSHVSTSSTTPACGQIVGEGLPCRNTVETEWNTGEPPDVQSYSNNWMFALSWVLYPNAEVLQSKSSANPSQVQQAWARCQLQAMQAIPVSRGVIIGPVVVNLERNKMAKLCMQAAGY